jgi:uncharacterized protein YhfF
MAHREQGADGAVSAFWADYCRAAGLDPATPYDVERFGDSDALADELIGLVLAGTKRATASLVRVYEAEDRPLPKAGDHVLWLDGQGRPAAISISTEVQVGRLDSVDAAFARDEGEGDRTLDWWLDAHRRNFTREAVRDGWTFGPDGVDGEPTVFERFRVVWPAEAVSPADRA